MKAQEYQARRKDKVRPPGLCEAEGEGQYAQAHLDLGRALASQGQTDEAKKHLEEALRILKTAKATNTTSKTDEPLSR